MRRSPRRAAALAAAGTLLLGAAPASAAECADVTHYTCAPDYQHCTAAIGFGVLDAYVEVPPWPDDVLGIDVAFVLGGTWIPCGTLQALIDCADSTFAAPPATPLCGPSYYDVRVTSLTGRFVSAHEFVCSISYWLDCRGSFFECLSTGDDCGGTLSFTGRSQVAVGVREGERPAGGALHANVPDPFESWTRLEFDVARPGPVRLAIYDVAGRLVRRLLDEHAGPGRRSVLWDGTDDAGAGVPAGTYFYRVETPSFRDTGKMHRIR